MTEKKIDEKDLQKALSVLQDLAKGHSSRGTAVTAVETMSGVGGATQIHHTASNSDPGSWAGSTARDVPENGATDAVDANGTDYKGGAQMVKSILDKLSKGIPLTAEEYSVVKGLPPFMSKDKDKDDKDDKKKDEVKKAAPDFGDDDDDKDDKKKDVKKSLAEEAAGNEAVAKGMEISDFLAEFVGVISKSLSGVEARITKNVIAAVGAQTSHQEEFNKSLAGALGTLGEGLAAQAQRVDQVEQTPARGPKSHMTTDGINKSFDGPGGEQLSKSQIAATLVDMVQSGKLAAPEVIRFDSSGGQISEELLHKVRSHRAGK